LERRRHRSPKHIRIRFIHWTDPIYAGYGWDGGYVIKSAANAVIRYSELDGGHVSLNNAITSKAHALRGISKV